MHSSVYILEPTKNILIGHKPNWHHPYGPHFTTAMNHSIHTQSPFSPSPSSWHIQDFSIAMSATVCQDSRLVTFLQAEVRLNSSFQIFFNHRWLEVALTSVLVMRQVWQVWLIPIVVAWNYGATFSVRESSHTGTNYLRMWSRQTLWIHSRIGCTRNGAFKVQRTSQPVINKYK